MRRYGNTLRLLAFGAAKRHAQNSWRPADVPVVQDPHAYLDFGHPEDPLHYQLLAIRPGSRLYEVKLRYLLQARRHHPEVGGDPEHFLRVCLAYQDVMKDYGIEAINGTFVNLGNFQSCPSTAQEYLRLRAAIKEEIPYSTLLDHIQELEAVELKLLDAKRELIESGKIGKEQCLLTEVGVMSDEQANHLFPETRPIEIEAPSSSAEQLQPPETIAAADCHGDGGRGPSSIVTGPAAPSIALRCDPELKQIVDSISADDIMNDSGMVDDDLLAQAILSEDELKVYERKYDVEYRNDVAGEAARCATSVMNNVGEVKSIKFHALGAAMIWMSIIFLFYAAFESMQRKRNAGGFQGSVKQEDMLEGTQLPWWGNDIEYERQVKRLFVEEWMNARRKARRVQTYQDGVQRESLSPDLRDQEDADVFTVTPEHLAKVRAHALAQNGKY